MNPAEFSNALVELIEANGVEEAMGLPAKVIARAMLRGVESGLHLLGDLEAVGALNVEIEE